MSDTQFTIAACADCRGPVAGCCNCGEPTPHPHPKLANSFIACSEGCALAVAARLEAEAWPCIWNHTEQRPRLLPWAEVEADRSR